MEERLSHGHGALLPIYRTACGKSIAELGPTPYALTDHWDTVTCPECLEAHKRGDGCDDAAVTDAVEVMKRKSGR